MEPHHPQYTLLLLSVMHPTLNARVFWVVIACCAIAPLPAVALDMGLGLDSRYITEGRDNTEGRGIAYAQLGMDVDGTQLQLWYANAGEGNYQEVNVGARRAWDVSGFELGLGVTYLSVIDAGLDDLELDASARRHLSKNFEAGVGLTYSHQSQGVYGMLELVYSRRGERVIAEPYISVGINSGYVVEEHAGPDNVQAGLSIRDSRTEQLVLHFAFVEPVRARSSDSLVRAQWASLSYIKRF